MKIFKIVMITLCVCLTVSCNSKKASSDSEISNMKTTMTDTEMMDAGFLAGTIVASKADGDCPFVIKTDGKESVMYDPINIEDAYKKDGMKVWFTFRGLRMMNRCTKANPVELVEMRTK
ncbi:hypothetical protein [Patiriisocius marinus]|nr:hypothetical protein [Patiriisocius marinus]